MSDRFRVTVRLGETVFSALESAAKFYNRSKSDIVKEALIKWLEERDFLKRGD